ncbi:uncharacterized [Tachysurus ichikawai]
MYLMGATSQKSEIDRRVKSTCKKQKQQHDYVQTTSLRGKGDTERKRGKENKNHTDRSKESQKDTGVPGLQATGGYHACLVGWHESQNANVAVSNACSCTPAH